MTCVYLQQIFLKELVINADISVQLSYRGIPTEFHLIFFMFLPAPQVGTIVLGSCRAFVKNSIFSVPVCPD